MGFSAPLPPAQPQRSAERERTAPPPHPPPQTLLHTPLSSPPPPPLPQRNSKKLKELYQKALGVKRWEGRGGHGFTRGGMRGDPRLGSGGRLGWEERAGTHGHQHGFNLRPLSSLYRSPLCTPTPRPPDAHRRSAIPHPRILGIVRECGGKMHMHDRNWQDAATDFFEVGPAFRTRVEFVCACVRACACWRVRASDEWRRRRSARIWTGGRALESSPPRPPHARERHSCSPPNHATSSLSLSHTHTHTHTHIHTHKQTNTHTHTRQTHTQAHTTNTHTHKQTQKHTHPTPKKTKSPAPPPRRSARTTRRASLAAWRASSIWCSPTC